MNPLSQLRDIHFPTFYGLWPLPVGWYFVFLFLAIGVFVGVRMWRLRERKVAPRREAIKKLQQLKARYERDGDVVAVAIELSMLLRRAALAKFKQVEVAGLHDDEWLEFLDKSGQTNEFTSGAGRVLISAPYQRSADYAADDLFALVDDWIRINLEGAKSKR